MSLARPQLAVIGLGLIGGSAARAFREAGVVGPIVGFDADAEQIEAAFALGVIDRIATSAAAAVASADIVLIAVPVLATAGTLRDIAAALPRDCIVTDVGSTKVSVLDAVREVFGHLPPRFVGAHPIAGTERSGVAHSRVDLFRDHRVVLTPHADQDPLALQQVVALWSAAGARVIELEAGRHDAIFAATSHLPHLLAFAFVDMLASRSRADTEIFPYAGGGFRDFTRIASSSPRMWHDIIRANAGPVSELLAAQIVSLQTLKSALDGCDWPALEATFARARAAREQHLPTIE